MIKFIKELINFLNKITLIDHPFQIKLNIFYEYQQGELLHITFVVFNIFTLIPILIRYTDHSSNVNSIYAVFIKKNLLKVKNFYFFSSTNYHRP